MTFNIFFTSLLILVSIIWGAYLYYQKEVIYRQYGEEGIGGVQIRAARRRAFLYRRQVIYIWLLFVINTTIQAYVDFGELMAAPYLDFVRILFVAVSLIQLVLLYCIIMKTKKMLKEDKEWESF